MRFTFEEDFVKPQHTRRKSDPGLDVIYPASKNNNNNENQHSKINSNLGSVFSPIG